MTPSPKRDIYINRDAERTVVQPFKPATKKPPSRKREAQLAYIGKLVLDSKIKKFRYSFICGRGYSPPLGGKKIAFCLQSEHAVRRVFLVPARKNDVLRVAKFEKR